MHGRWAVSQAIVSIPLNVPHSLGRRAADFNVKCPLYFEWCQSWTLGQYLTCCWLCSNCGNYRHPQCMSSWVKSLSLVTAPTLVVVAGFALFLWDWCPLCPHRERPTPFLRTNLTSHGNQKIRRGGRILFETKCSSMINQVTLISKAAVFLMSTEQLCVSSCASLLPLFSSTVMWDGWLETIIY